MKLKTGTGPIFGPISAEKLQKDEGWTRTGTWANLRGILNPRHVETPENIKYPFLKF